MSKAKAQIDVEINSRAAVKSLKSLEKTVEKATGGIGMMAVKFNALSMVAGKVAGMFGDMWKAGGEGAAFNATMGAFKKAGGNIEVLRHQTMGMVSDFELVKKANLAKVMGIPADAFGGLSKIAEAAALQTGESMEFMLDSIIKGTARQSKLILDNLGIIVSVGDANDKYAKELGKVSSELTEAEKRQGFLNEVLEKGDVLLGGVDEKAAAASREIAQINVDFENLFNTLKADLVPIIQDHLNPALRTMHELLSGDQAAKAVAQDVGAASMAKMAKRLQGLKDTRDAIKDAIEHEDWDLMDALVGRRAAKLKGFSPESVMGGMDNAIDTLNEKMGKLSGTMQGVNDASAAISGGGPVKHRNRKVKSAGGKGDKSKADDPLDAATFGPTRDEFEAAMAAREEIRQKWIAEQTQSMETARLDWIEDENRKTQMTERFANIRAQAEIEAMEKVAEYQKTVFTDQEAGLLYMTEIATSAFSMMTGDMLGALESLAAGQEVNWLKMASGWIKSIGMQVMGDGIGTMSSSVSDLIKTKGVYGWHGLAAGAAQVAIGGGMAATGAVSSGLATRMASIGGASVADAGAVNAASTPGVNKRQGQRSRAGGGDTSSTYVFNAPIYGDQGKAARNQAKLQRIAQRDLLERR